MGRADVTIVSARCLLDLPYPGAEIHGSPLARAPELVTESDVEWIELYTGSSDPDDLAYCRWMIRADATITLDEP
jgi:hypothetical protein